MKNVLISAPYMLRESEIKMLTPEFDKLGINYTLAKVEERLEEEDLLKIIDQYDAIICGDDRFTRKVYEKAKKLKIIVKWGTGIDSLNEDIAREFGVRIYRTPGAFTIPVSDTTMALMLGAVRNINLNDQIIKNGGWDKPQGYTLGEKTIGLFGFGDIGRAVAKKIMPFGAKVLAYDIKKFDAHTYASCGAVYATPDEIFEQADIISLHTDLNSTSEFLLNKNTFAKMKKRPYIINTARGPLIREADLISALQSGQVSGAGLDVFEVEPLPLGSPLRKMNNVLLASHNSNSSPACWKNVHYNCIRMLKEGLHLQ